MGEREGGLHVALSLLHKHLQKGSGISCVDHTTDKKESLLTPSCRSIYSQGGNLVTFPFTVAD